jgi:hypothetical protein
MKHAVRLGVDSIDEQWAPFWKKSHVNIHVDNLRVCNASLTTPHDTISMPTCAAYNKPEKQS